MEFAFGAEARGNAMWRIKNRRKKNEGRESI
jgi:hypothetical protein